MAGLHVALETGADGGETWLGPPLADPSERFLNRELSWLEFNARVLALGEDAQLPLLERVKFLAIFSQNLDEFFEVRVAGLMEQLAAGLRATTPDGLDLVGQLRAIRNRVDQLVARAAAVFGSEIMPALESAGIRFVDWDELSEADRVHLDDLFAERIFPVLTPLAVDPAHPFPYISNLSLNLAVTVRDPSSGEERFARVKVPPLLPRFVELPDDDRFVLLEQVIAAKLDALFPGMEVLAQHPFRVTRDADFELEDEAEDLLEAIESELRRRSKFGRVVRLEVDTKMTNEVLELLCRELELSDADVNVIDGPLDLGGLWSIYALDRPELKDEPWVPQTPALLQGIDPEPDFFRLLKTTDVLVHHPYDSFATSVEEFVEQAASDPHVLAIKQTIYRTAGPDSALVQSLIKAAEGGKQVVALVELKARFDEQANIARARVLEEAGVHVVYGLVGLKTHAKVLLVVRQEADGIRRYCHVGTGNYNPKTASLYEDLGLLSADPDLGADLTDLFNHLTGYSHQGAYRKLLVAPSHLRRALVDRIEAQAELGDAGRITMKMNSLVDPALIDSLYDAAQRGVQIDLIVRGICCLRPQVRGLSDNIRVRSIVGRFLEHSRVYRFGTEPEGAEYLIGSADLMPRNLDHRVEALVPVTTARLRGRLAEMLDLDLADDTLAWALRPDGTWHKVSSTAGLSTHRALQELALARARTRLKLGAHGLPRPVKERELKFTPGPTFRMPELADAGAGFHAEASETIRLQAAYFDTADLRLARAGASLRYRSDEGWMVKLPVSRDTMLTRMELNVAGDPGEPPTAALDLVHALIRHEPVRLAARLNTVRQRCRVLDEQREQLAEIVDDEVSVLDGARLAARFREIEVEFTDTATAEIVDGLEVRLEAAGAGPADLVPKIVRALGPRALDPPDLAVPPALDFASTPLEVLRGALASSTARLIAHDPGVRLGTDSEDVHQARVATRRLRSDLRTFHAVVDPVWSESLRDELRWMGECLGAVRDTDVLLERFEARLAALPLAEAVAGKQFLTGLHAHRDAARTALLAAMRSDRYLLLLDRLVAASHLIPAAMSDDATDLELGDLVVKPWRKLRGAVEELGDDPPDAELHAVRIRAKRCRYAAEAVAPAIGKAARQFARAVAGLQEVLGEHQDAVIAGQWLREHAADGGGRVEAAFVAGELAAMERVAADASREAWTAAWKHARAKHLREWM